MPAEHGSIHDGCSQGSKLKKKRLHCSGSRMRRCSPTDTWGGDMRYFNMVSPQKDFSSQSLYFLGSYIEMGGEKISKSNRKLEQPPTEGQSPFNLSRCKKMGRRVAPSAQGEHLASLPKREIHHFPWLCLQKMMGV